MMNNRFLDEKLHRLCQEASLSELKTYLEHGIVGNINNGDAKTGDTPLHYASSAKKNSSEMTRMLLEYGANPCSLNSKAETPVHCAARIGNLDTLKLLVDRGGLSGILNHMIRGNSKYGKESKRRRHASSSRKSRYGPSAPMASQNLLQVACESENNEIVEFLIDEILSARRSHFDEQLSHNEPKLADLKNEHNCSGSTSGSSGLGSTTGIAYIGGPDGRHAEGFDVREFLEYTEPRQVVFFELGCDLAASNAAFTTEQQEQSLYGLMLSKTPQAFVHLLDNCIFTRGRKRFVDFFLFHNPNGSEVNLLKIIIHYKKFELLTHPVCEMFLHLKWLRARWLYWIVVVVYLFFSLVVIAYALLLYGEIGWYLNPDDGNHCTNGTFPDVDTNPDHSFTHGSLYCIGDWLRIPVLVLAGLMGALQTAKLIQDRGAVLHPNFWIQHPEEFTHFAVIVLIILDQVKAIALIYHKLIAAFLVLGSCRITMHTIARDPDIAIFVEMVSNITHSLMKFFLGYVWLFVGWIIAFHVTLGDGEELENGFRNSFHDLGSATAKVMAMFTGELGFETAFSAATNLSSSPVYNSFVMILYVAFIVEMAVILMNLIIGLAISNIQDLRNNADALRLVKEVLLQRYLESLLRLLSIFRLSRIEHFVQNKCLSCREDEEKIDGSNFSTTTLGVTSPQLHASSSPTSLGPQHHCPPPTENFGQLVTSDLFLADAIYCLGQMSSDHKLFLTLVDSRHPVGLFHSSSVANGKNVICGTNANRILGSTPTSINVPSTVVAKLRLLMKGREQQRGEKDQAQDLRKLLAEMKTQLDELRKLVTNAVKPIQSKAPMPSP
ncbi:hypothetical protein TCAL_09681 [Tigriopus californicus]|uniref:Ion transport domain-containing protein n=1 Tax=Tigriopus californicus TaxID=6832 RepID=A0A553NZ14_TIGCA|nr:hypothetical protein TCAL_09681 [Tigriopus californicus]|eukprot:TCALIF_09681-PA protein Name:"Similar to pyx Transient receptor potential channel pyrexia (Drosophila melanogaster)" AED:0.22 eAED:0.24 QI:0/-1/0/1/-1/1/1/0/834